MDQHSAKLATLQNLIDSMTGHMLGGAKKKGTMVVDIKADAKPIDVTTADESSDEPKMSDEHDDMDGDALSSLMDLYGRDADEVKKKDDEDEEDLRSM